MKQIPPNIRNKWVLDQHNTFGVPAGYADTFVQKAFGKLVLLVILFIYVENPCIELKDLLCWRTHALYQNRYIRLQSQA